MRKAAALFLVASLVLLSVATAFAAEEKKYGPNVGDSMKPFSLAEPVVGKTYTLDDFTKTGNDTAIVFMQTACSLCIAEIRDILEKQDDFKGKLNVVLISADFEESRIKPYKENNAIPFPILHDKDAAVLESVNLSSTPSTVVVDGKGVIKSKSNGYNKAEMKNFLKGYK